jgi:hypothetical protein
MQAKQGARDIARPPDWLPGLWGKAVRPIGQRTETCQAAANERAAMHTNGTAGWRGPCAEYVMVAFLGACATLRHGLVFDAP